MKLGLNLVLAGLVAVALLVPAATAKPGENTGKGSGKSNGPPAWVGAGSGGAKKNGKPAWAGKPESTGKAAAPGQLKKAAKVAQREAGDAEPATVPKHGNPAWTCKFERGHMGDEAFSERYGGAASAFGRCVSTEAHDRDGVTGGAEEPPAEPEVVEALVVLRTFFDALTGLVL
jgi:hypothetical protein